MRIFHLDFGTAWGGGQRQVLLVARGLAARGHRQWVVAPPGSPLLERTAAEGHATVPHAHRLELDPIGIVRLAALVRRHRPDVLHAHDSHALLQAALAARLVRPRPAVIGHRRVARPIGANPVSRWKHRRGADRVIAVGRHVRGLLAEGGVDPDRVAVVPDAVEPGPPPSPGAPGLRARIGAPAGAPLLLTIAALVGSKDHPTLLAAAGELRGREPATRWVVCGDGPLLSAIRREAGERGLGDRVHHLGFVPDARGLLPETDVFVLTSSSEGLGSSVLDAMAAGVPVVATAAGGVPEVVEDGVSGLLAPVGDATAIAGAVDRLLDDPPLAARLAAAARERLPRFDPGRTAARTEAVYRSALERLEGYSGGIPA